jgi:hypothetical protein
MDTFELFDLGTATDVTKNGGPEPIPDGTSVSRV